MIKLVDNKLNSDNSKNKFPRMPQTGGNIILYGERPLNL